MSEIREFPTTAAERYDRALRKGLALNPLPSGYPVPQPTSSWPDENVLLLERFRDWLVGIGAADSTINQHRIPMAGHVLGLNLKPHAQFHLDEDLSKAMVFVKAKKKGAMFTRNCGHSLTWFRRFLKVERGLVILDTPTFGDISRYQEGLPEWLVTQLTKLLHIRQANWRQARLAQGTYHFWFKTTQLWRWLFANTGVQLAADVTRDHIFGFIDQQLVAGYKASSINCDLHMFQGTLRFLQQQGIAIPHHLLTMSSLKRPQSLPRFLTDSQVTALRDDLHGRLAQAKTAAAKRNSQLDLAAFYLLWQTGLRLSELEDLQLGDIDLENGKLLVRRAKGLKDRAVYLTNPVIAAIQGYLKVRGPALSDHLFIYRHKPLSKDLVRSRLKGASQRLGFKVTPHMLRHTFATQLVNAGAKITTIQALLGHKRLNTTMTYANVHAKTVAKEYYRAMALIEGEPQPLPPKQDNEETVGQLLDKLFEQGLTSEQHQLLEQLRGYLSQ